MDLPSSLIGSNLYSCASANTTTSNNHFKPFFQRFNILNSEQYLIDLTVKLGNIAQSFLDRNRLTRAQRVRKCYFHSNSEGSSNITYSSNFSKMSNLHPQVERTKLYPYKTDALFCINIPSLRADNFWKVTKVLANRSQDQNWSRLCIALQK